MVSGGLVVWATTWTGPFVAGDARRRADLAGRARALTRDRLTGIALAGRTLVWGQASDAAGTGVVAAVDVDGGGTTTLAAGLSGLAGPAYDGTDGRLGGEDRATGARVMGRRLGGAAFPVATVAGVVTEVAVSGDTVAWISHSGGAYSITTTELPR